eukprot:jgi/Psemu1/9658/gm1.9658_g
MTSFKLTTSASLLLSLIASGSLAKAAENGSMHSHSTEASVSPVEYVDTNDPGFDLLGYVSIPQSEPDGSGQLLPGVVILPVSFSFLVLLSVHGSTLSLPPIISGSRAS